MKYPLIEISGINNKLGLYRSINFSFVTRGIKKLQIVLSGEKKQQFKNARLKRDSFLTTVARKYVKYCKNVVVFTSMAMLNHVVARSRIKWPRSDGSNTSHYFSRPSIKGADQQVLEINQVNPRLTSGIRRNFNRTFDESNILSLERILCTLCAFYIRIN